MTLSSAAQPPDSDAIIDAAVIVVRTVARTVAPPAVEVVWELCWLASDPAFAVALPRFWVGDSVVVNTSVLVQIPSIRAKIDDSSEKRPEVGQFART